jgi:hypothetical protein
MIDPATSWFEIKGKDKHIQDEQLYFQIVSNSQYISQQDLV